VRRQSRGWVRELIGVRVLAILSPLAPRPRYVLRAGPGRSLYTVGGAAFVVSTEEFHALGGFDERFFMYYEDTDLSERYRRAGYRLQASSALVARHHQGTSAPAARLNALAFLGWLEYLEKWHGHATAARAAWTARVCLALALALARVLWRLGRSDRARAKTLELQEMLSDIATKGLQPAAGEQRARYPAAAPLAARVFAPWAALTDRDT
jgi:GT2 family glycosyltransferase